MFDSDEPYIDDWTNSVTPVDRSALRDKDACVVRLAYNDPEGIVPALYLAEERLLQGEKDGVFKCHVNWDVLYSSMVSYFVKDLFCVESASYVGTDRPKEFNRRGDFVYFTVSRSDYMKMFGIPYSTATSDAWHVEEQIYRMIPRVHDLLGPQQKSIYGLVCPDGHEYSRDSIMAEYLIRVLDTLYEQGYVDEAIDMVRIHGKKRDSETQTVIDNPPDKVYSGDCLKAESASQPITTKQTNNQ